MGQITSVSYRRLRNLGNYENEVVEASSDISASETPEEALAALRQWVHGQLGQVEQHTVRQRQIAQQEARLDELDQQIQRAAARYENAKRFLNFIGVPIPAAWTPEGDDALPF